VSCRHHDPAEWRPLNAAQRRARLIAGVVLLLLAVAPLGSGAGWVALAVIAGWFGATRVLAAAMAYPGCPELGAFPVSCSDVGSKSAAPRDAGWMRRCG
jgi:hypothetical protein